MRKCPKCGFNYGEFDVCCSRCGYKFKNIDSESSDIQADLNAFAKLAKKDPSILYSNNDNPKKTFNSKKASLFDNASFTMIICFVIVSLALSLILYMALQSHKNKKMQLQFKNYMNNPSQIPELKEPQNTKELSSNLSSVENFLLLYLKYSQDSSEKKQQVFIAFLNEMEKLPHLTNDDLIRDDIDSCSVITETKKAQKCVIRFNNNFRHLGIVSFNDSNTIYLYPDYKFYYKTYGKYLPNSMNEYLKLRAKYNHPSAIGANLQIKPKVLADKIADFEKLYLYSPDSDVKELCEKILYNDVKKFIFNSSAYSSTTQELTSEFESAYKYFISSKRNSGLRPLIMSSLDKKKNYSEKNFAKDYPYKTFDSNSAHSIENATFNDAFSAFRKNLVTGDSKTSFAYIYSITSGWDNYEKTDSLNPGRFVISNLDENNNAIIYNNTFSPVQELNISRYSQLFLYNKGLYIFNQDRLKISKINFNGTNFNILDLSLSDITSLFPGVQVINLDSYSNYNINIEKDNQKASYIILSRYAQNLSQYILTPIQGDINTLLLPNMFSVSSEEDVVISFHDTSVNAAETSESFPSYKLTIHTRGHRAQEVPQDTEFATYDEQTVIEEQNQENYEPNIKPKIENGQNADIDTAPKQNIEPPKEN